MVGDLEKPIWQKRWRFGETWSANWRTCSAKYVGDLEKRGWQFGELVRQNTLAILYSSSLWSSLELGDLNGEKTVMETNYGDQNFIHHKVESTYLEHFKDRNI